MSQAPPAPWQRWPVPVPHAQPGSQTRGPAPSQPAQVPQRPNPVRFPQGPQNRPVGGHPGPHGPGRPHPFAPGIPQSNARRVTPSAPEIREKPVQSMVTTTQWIPHPSPTGGESPRKNAGILTAHHVRGQAWHIGYDHTRQPMQPGSRPGYAAPRQPAPIIRAPSPPPRRFADPPRQTANQNEQPAEAAPERVPSPSPRRMAARANESTFIPPLDFSAIQQPQPSPRRVEQRLSLNATQGPIIVEPLTNASQLSYREAYAITPRRASAIEAVPFHRSVSMTNPIVGLPAPPVPFEVPVELPHYLQGSERPFFLKHKKRHHRRDTPILDLIKVDHLKGRTIVQTVKIPTALLFADPANIEPVIINVLNEKNGVQIREFGELEYKDEDGDWVLVNSMSNFWEDILPARRLRWIESRDKGDKGVNRENNTTMRDHGGIRSARDRY